MAFTREEWLDRAIEKLRPLFEDHQLTIPGKIRVSVGWPSTGGTRAKNRVVGQCWPTEAATDGVVQIFISPFLGSDPLDILGTLAHELIHAALPKAKHGKAFKDAAKEIGLEGPPKSTTVGPLLFVDLQKIADALGDFDNARLDKVSTAAPEKPQSTRQLKVFCPRKDLHDEEAEYILRGSNKTLLLGIPKCGICGTDMVKEEKEEEKE